MTGAWLMLVAAAALICANGFFVAAEFSLTTADRGRLTRAADRGERRAASALAAVRTLTFQLSGAQLGITVTSLLVGMLAEPALRRLLRPALEATGLPGSAAAPITIALGMIIANLVQMVIGELIPKNLAIALPETVARLVATGQRGFSATLRPVIAVCNAAANRIVRAFGVEPTEELATVRTPAELVAVARHSAREGTLEADTADLFARAVAVRDLTAAGMMTPRVKVIALEHTAHATDVVNLTRATGFSRFPVYRDRLDDIRAVVTLKDALAVPADRRDRTSVTEAAGPPLLVPASLGAAELLRRLRHEQPLAVVVDEYGGTAGVVTLEDIVEELVGEVRDEHDPGQRPDLLPLPAAGRDGATRAWEAAGQCRVEILRQAGLDVPDGPYETVAGLVADRLGRIPRRGDTVRLPGLRIEVLDVAHHHAETTRITAAGPRRLSRRRGGDRHR